jgi:hypothetical protein
MMASNKNINDKSEQPANVKTKSEQPTNVKNAAISSSQ